MRSKAMLDEYEARVSAIMAKRYGLTWDDASGDHEPLERALDDEQAPDEFVEWFAEKYGLERIERAGWYGGSS
jgi:hypothetical protein